MNTKKKTIKSILGCTTACSAILLSGVGVMNLQSPSQEIHAVNVDNISVNINNANFNGNTSSSYPFSPNYFTASKNSADAEANVTAGVINLSNEKYETKFENAKRSSLDNYVLMIDSTKEDDKGNVTMHTVEYGYSTSSTITLDANSKYMFSVDVFTATNAKIGSLRLIDDNGEIYSSIDGINSYNTWTPYSFFISTSNYESLNLKLAMYLDGAGTVLFDNISCMKLSDYGYNLHKNNFPSETYTEKSEVDNVLKTFSISDEDTLSDGTNSTNFTCVEYEIGNSPLTYVKESNGKNAILIKNTEDTYTQYETDEILTFEPNRIYKVSVDVKTKDINGTASLELVRTDIDKDDEKYDAANHNKTIKITSNTYSSSKSVTNDYQTYSFLIRTHSSETLKYKLKFGLGLVDAKSSGEMYLNKIEVSKINYSTFNGSTGTNEKIDFVETYVNNENMLDNADFNAFEIEDYNAPIPAKPLYWEVKTGSNNQKYGVVNTATLEEDLSSLNLSNLANPSSNNNNVLMMYNETADTLIYKSTSKNLTANSYHKFEIELQTQNAPLKIALVSNRDSNEIVLLEKTLNTNFSWQKVSLYIHTGYQSMDVSLKLTLETDGYGYAYVDNARYDWKSNPEMPATQAQIEEEFKTASNSTYTGVVDLANIFASESIDNFSTPTFFTTPSMNGVQSGTITFNSNHLDEVIDSPEVQGETNLDLFNSLAGTEVDKKALAIWTTDYVNYTITSKTGFSLVKGSDSASAKYYKLTVDVFTQNLESESKKFGAGIKLTGFDNSFTNIESNNKWTTYTFYIKPSSNTTTFIELSLGGENTLTKGAVFFANITLDDTIEASEYNAVKESNIVKVVKTEEDKKEDDKETTEETKKDNKTSKTEWIFLIPGLLTAAAILIAIIGFLVRKIKWKNPFKRKSKTAYDRNKTVSVQYYSRKATIMREEEVRTLTADLEKINEERKQYEEQYKQDLTKLREMKIKRASSAEISKLDKEMKKYQRISSNLGITANRISEELEYIKTDMYLDSLIRKLQREQSQKVDEEVEEK